MCEVISNSDLDFGACSASIFRYFDGCVEGAFPFFAVCSDVDDYRRFVRFRYLRNSNHPIVDYTFP